MRKSVVTLTVLLSGAAAAQGVPASGWVSGWAGDWAGDWDVTSRVAELSVPGVPRFLQRMARGRSQAEHKHLVAGANVEALLAPDPKARCHVDSQHVGGGRYMQVLSCPQKQGEPMRIARAGFYTSAGFVGRATVSGSTPKGPVSITLDQHAARVGG